MLLVYEISQAMYFEIGAGLYKMSLPSRVNFR